MLLAAISIECSRSPLLLLTTLAVIGTAVFLLLSDIDVALPDAPTVHKKVQTAMHTVRNFTKG
jgi:hypothetical protein